MATYGADFYALTKYGTPIAVDYGIDPFLAEPLGEGRTRVQWVNPTGEWTRFRLLRSRYGYAVTPDDGDILLDLTPPSPGQIVDLDGDTPSLSPFRYYSLWIEIDGDWQRAGVTSTLALTRTDTVDRLLAMLPRYFRLSSGAELTGNNENQDLIKFVTVLAYGVDYVRTYAATLPSVNDPGVVHLADLESLASQFGIEYLHALPGRLMRQRVMNGSLLAKQRGVLTGLRDLVALSVGFDVELTYGHNLMLNADQSSFYSPVQYPEWDVATQYTGPNVAQARAGDRVVFAGNEFEAKAIGALGNAQKPELTAIDNTWWVALNRHNDGTLYNSRTTNISTWQALLQGPESALYDVLPITSADALSVDVGATSDVHTGRNDSNVLIVKNTSAGTRDVLVRSISYLAAGTTWDPELVVRYGVPVPQAINAWDAAMNYERGDIVVHKGRSWRALRETLGAQPQVELDTDDVWEALGFDERIRCCVSGYAHGPLTGSPGTGGLAVDNRVFLFDEHGNFLLTLTATSTTAFLDTFTRTDTGVWTTRVADVRPAAQVWAVTTGANWSVADGFAFPTNPTTTQLTRVASLTADGRVAVTFGANAMPGKQYGLALRISGATNYIRASRTKLEKVVAGTPTTLATYSTPCVEGDRLMVDMTGNVLTVYRNGVQVGTATDSFNASATAHGMFTA